jgi:hypothetical protein
MSQDYQSLARNLAGPLWPWIADRIAAFGIAVPRSSGAALFAIDCTSQGAALTIANNATAQPTGGNNFSGLLLVNDTNVTGSLGVFAVGGGGGIAKVADTLNAFTTTKDTAGKINVYPTAPGPVEIQNKNGSSITFNVMAIRTRASL